MRALDGESDDFSAADEQQIRDLLAAQPRPTMPPAVQERILAGLAAEPHPDFARTASAGSSGMKWLGVAAAAAVLVLAGVILAPQLRTDSATVADQPTAQEQSLAGAADPLGVDCSDKPLTYNSGTRYQQAALTTQAQALVPAACRTEAATAESPAAQPPRTGTDMAPQVAERSLRCVVRVASSAEVMVLDRGYYEGTPAVVAVVTPPRRALAVDCRKQPAEVLMDVQLP